jgi:magnesium transporter
MSASLPTPANSPTWRLGLLEQPAWAWGDRPGTDRSTTMESVIVDSGVYLEGRRVETAPDVRSAVARIERSDDAFCWIGIVEPTEAELGEVEQAFHLHRLAVEDALHARERPKLDLYGDTILLSLKTLWYDPEHSAVSSGELYIFVGANFIVTVRYGEGTQLGDIRADLERKAGLLGHGPAGILYAICDHVVDSYADVTTELEADTDDVEQSVFSGERTNDANAIYRVKRELLRFRKAARPLVEPMTRLADGSVDLVPAEAQPFFRSVREHLEKLAEYSESLDDLLTSALSSHLTRVSVQQNEDVRKISAAAAIVAVPTMIAGIYGMNFVHMPELEWRLGYPLVMVVMAAACYAVYRYFKAKKWL